MRVDGRYLHSKYAPLKEADRAASEYVPTNNVATLFVLGEGIPYCSRAIARRRPDLAIHAITVTAESVDASMLVNQHPVEVPSEDTIRRLVRRLVHPLAVGRVDALVWPPAERCVPRWVDTVRSGLLAGLEDVRSQLATTASFGRLWLKNALRRTIGAETRREITETTPTITVIAGGPSVEHGVTAMLRSDNGRRSHRTIAAATSAAGALAHRGVVPDLLFHADAGFWAQRYRTIDGNARPPTVVSLRSSIAPGSPVANDGDIFLRQGWFGESLAPDHDDWVTTSEFPTVTATMISFLDRVAPMAERFELLGIDLCSYDALTHARPHPNEEYIDRRSSRLTPLSTVRLLRAGVFSGPPRYRWRDGTSAFQSPSLSAFTEPLATLIQEVSRKHTVQHLYPSPIWRESANVGTTSPRGGPAEYGDDRSRSSAFRTREVCRPRKSERVAHAIETLRGWRSVVAASETQRDILLHIAPVRTLQALRGETSIEEAVADASDWIERLIGTVRDVR